MLCYIDFELQIKFQRLTRIIKLLSWKQVNIKRTGELCKEKSIMTEKRKFYQQKSLLKMPKTYQKYQYLLKRKSPRTNDIARFDILNSHIRDISIFSVMNNISLRYLFQTQAICCNWKMVYSIDLSSLILFIRLCVERRQNVVHFFVFGK